MFRHQKPLAPNKKLKANKTEFLHLLCVTTPAFSDIGRFVSKPAVIAESHYAYPPIPRLLETNNFCKN
jgi:hypothetical protein